VFFGVCAWAPPFFFFFFFFFDWQPSSIYVTIECLLSKELITNNQTLHTKLHITEGNTTHVPKTSTQTYNTNEIAEKPKDMSKPDLTA